MEHNHHTAFTVDPCVIGIVAIALITGIIWLIHRNHLASDGLTVVERKKLPYPQNEILSMLRQHGGAMMQDEIVDTLPGDLEEIVEAIRDMEGKDLIFRKWKHDQGSYLISAKTEGLEK